MVVLRLLKVLGILVAALVLAVAGWLLRPEQVGLARQPLVNAAWGDDGEGLALGSAPGPDGQRYGPASFAVDAGGWLYVADTYRHRVLVFDATGEPRGEFALPGGFACSDLAVDGRGALHLVDGRAGRLLKLDRSGAVVWEGAIPGVLGGGPGLVAVESAAAGPGGELYLLGYVLDDDRYHRRVSRHEGPGRETVLAVREVTRGGPVAAPEGALDAFVRSLAVDSRGTLYLHVQEPGEDGGKLLVLPEGKRPAREISLAGLELPSPVRLAGVDRWGRVYLATVDPSDPVKLWVLDGRGKLLAARELHAPGPVLLRVSVRVGPGGDVYTARSTRQGMEYAAWRPVLHPRLFRARLDQ